MSKLKRKGQHKSLQRIWNIDTVSAREVAEVAQKIRDATPHTRVFIMTEDELRKASHQTHDKAMEKTKEVTASWTMYAFCLYFSRYEHLGARAIVNRLQKIQEIADSLDEDYEFIQDIEALVYEETGVKFE